MKLTKFILKYLRKAFNFLFAKTGSLFQGYFLSLLIYEVLTTLLAKRDLKKQKKTNLVYLFLGAPHCLRYSRQKVECKMKLMELMCNPPKILLFKRGPTY